MEKKYATIQGEVITITDKAVKINCVVNYADSNNYMREFWFPKSVIIAQRGEFFDIAEWFIAKMEILNVNKGGYRMKIRIEDI